MQPTAANALPATAQQQLHHDDVVPNLPAPENRVFYPALDGLRALAVLMVFYQHYAAEIPALNWGWTGVDIFFVLSGFLITGILYDTRNTRFRFRNFYVRRTLRIFPLYYAVLLIALLLTPVFHWQFRAAHALVPLYLTNYVRFLWLHQWMQNPAVIDHLVGSAQTVHPQALFLSHFWSLAVEEQFYLVWPLIVFSMRDRVKLRDLCIILCCFCIVARMLCAAYVPAAYLDAELLNRATPLRADALLLGAVLALMLRGAEAEWLRRNKLRILAACVSPIALIQLFCIARFHHPFYYQGQRAVAIIGYTTIDLVAASVILITLYPGNVLYRIFSCAPLRRLGQVSYGFYVFHDIPHMAYRALSRHLVGDDNSTPGMWITAAIALTCTLALSFLSFRYFEAPFLRLKHAFTVRE